jgi:chromosome segregation ATPase
MSSGTQSDAQSAVVNVMKQEIAKQRTELKILQEQLSKTNTQYDELLEQHEAVNSQVIELQQAVTNAERANADLKDEIRKLASHNTDIEKKYSIAKEEITTQTNSMARFQDDAVMLDDINARSKRQQEKISMLQRELHEAVKECNDLRDRQYEYDDKIQVINRLRSDLDAADAQICAYRQDFDKEREDRENQHSLVIKLQGQVDSEKRRRQEHERTIERLKNTIVNAVAKDYRYDETNQRSLDYPSHSHRDTQPGRLNSRGRAKLLDGLQNMGTRTIDAVVSVLFTAMSSQHISQMRAAQTLNRRIQLVYEILVYLSLEKLVDVRDTWAGLYFF